jgi:hypothetical protein
VTLQVLNLDAGPPFRVEATLETTTDFMKATSKPVSTDDLVVRTPDGA